VDQARYGFDWSRREVPVGSEELTESLAPLMKYCIEQFGADRRMLESNFPVDKVSYSYNILYNALKRLSPGYAPAERAVLCHDTAARIDLRDV
jgi:predicted TIM-barrel fold metal-dependent hydrolase